MSNKTTNMWSINAQDSPNHPLQCSICLLTLKYFSSADWKHLLLTCRSFCRILPSEEDSWYYSHNLTRPTDNPMTGTLINSLSPIQLLSFIFPTLRLMGGWGTMCPQFCTTLRVIDNKVYFSCYFLLIPWEIHKFKQRFSSVPQSCPSLRDSMNHSTPGLPVYHQLSESTQTHVHRVSDAIQPSHPLLSLLLPSSILLRMSIFSNEMSELFSSCGQSIRVSASASVLSMNTQDWSPLGNT